MYELVLVFLRFFAIVPFAINSMSWSSGNMFVSGAKGLRFKPRAGQIRHSVANDSPPLRKKLCCLREEFFLCEECAKKFFVRKKSFFVERNCFAPGAKTRKWAPPIRYTYRRGTASIMKDS